MKFALCNEMFGQRPLVDVCATAATLGYHGIEFAPFTMASHAGDITTELIREVRATVEDHGLEVVGLHWLLVGPTGMHMTTTDEVVWNRTREYFEVLVELCGNLGGKVLVVGSPNQRSIVDGQSREGGWSRAVSLFNSVLDRAAEMGVTICIEPLSPVETNFINTVSEGMQMVREIEHPNFKLHLDVKAMWSESQSIDDIIRSVKVEDVGHFHVNDSNLYGPGMGDLDYAPIIKAVNDIGWDKWLSVEVFKFDPSPESIAEQSIQYLKRMFNAS